MRVACDGKWYVLSFHFPDGATYTGTRRVAYYPVTAEGFKARLLVRKVFEAGKLFRIGTSVTTGATDVVVFGGVHLKTHKAGGSANHGYPDPTWYQRLVSECAAINITV